MLVCTLSTKGQDHLLTSHQVHIAQPRGQKGVQRGSAQHLLVDDKLLVTGVVVLRAPVFGGFGGLVAGDGGGGLLEELRPLRGGEVGARAYLRRVSEGRLVCLEGRWVVEAAGNRAQINPPFDMLRRLDSHDVEQDAALQSTVMRCDASEKEHSQE
jgi:hypothetical protein